MPRRSLVACAFFLMSAAQALAASPYSAIYSFGDSLSDVGNVYLATSGVEPALPYVNRQFSNGPVWVQDLAGMLGLPALTPSSPSGGNDYAWGGATAGASVTTVPSLDLQVGQFLLQHGGAAPSRALYTFSIGANDLFGILKGSAPSKDLPVDAQAVATAAGAILSAGGKDLVLFDVPDLGKTPGILALGQAASDAASVLAYNFNQLVLADLAVEAAGLKVFDLNTFALIDQIVGPPQSPEFMNVTDPCWTGGYTGGSGTLCSDTRAGQNEYLFWDQVHPTAAAHAIVADVAYHLAVPESSTWAMMVFGFAGLGALGARRLRAAPAAG